MTQPDAYRIAIAQNVATNGRLFCILLAAANFSAGWHYGVATAAAPVALAWMADQVKPGKFQAGLARASIGSAVILAIATLINCR